MDVDGVFQTVQLLLEGWVEKFENPAPNRLDAYMARADDLLAAVAGLRVKRLGYLAAITGLDPGKDSEELEILYHFCAGIVVITLRVRVPKIAPGVPSLSQIIPSAEAFERELSEMFGVAVVGLRNQERLYLSDDWPDGVYPLRKDVDMRAVFAEHQAERSGSWAAPDR